MRLDEATERATALLGELSPSGDPARVMITRAELRDRGWLFFYSSTAFVQSRSFVDALGGDLPILVTPDGNAATIAHADIPHKAGDAIHPGA